MAVLFQRVENKNTRAGNTMEDGDVGGELKVDALNHNPLKVANKNMKDGNVGGELKVDALDHNPLKVGNKDTRAGNVTVAAVVVFSSFRNKDLD
jgi:hypothetical protein